MHRFMQAIEWYTMNMEPVSYFVRMRAKPGKAEQVLDLLLTNPRRIEKGKAGNLEIRTSSGCTRPGRAVRRSKRMKAVRRSPHTSSSSVRSLTRAP
jgi:hypothetical protein